MACAHAHEPRLAPRPANPLVQEGTPDFAWAEMAKRGLSPEQVRTAITLELQDCFGAVRPTVVLDHVLPVSGADVVESLNLNAWQDRESDAYSCQQRAMLEQRLCECFRSGGRCWVTLNQERGNPRLFLAALTARDRRRQRASWIGFSQNYADDAQVGRMTKLFERLGAQIQLALAQVQEVYAVGALAPADASAALSPRESECLLYVHAGYSSKEIARQLDLHVYTVDEYLRTATKKMGACNRGHAASRAALLAQLRAYSPTFPAANVPEAR